MQKRLLAAWRSVTLSGFALWTTTAGSLVGLILTTSLVVGGDDRFTVGWFIAVSIFVSAIREIVSAQRAEVPLIVAMAAAVGLWFVLDDPIFRAAVLIELALLPVAVVMLRPTLWKPILGGIAVVATAMMAFEVLGRDRPSVQVFIRMGVVAVISGGMVELIRRIDEQRRAAQARAVGIVNTTRIATVALNYRDVVAQFDRLRSFGISDVTHLLGSDRVQAFAKLVEQVAANEAAQTLHHVGNAPAFDDFSIGRLEATRSELTAVWNGETWVQHEFSYTRVDGSAGWVRQDWAAPVVDGKPDYELVVLTTVDITGLKEAEAVKTREVEARDQFIASVSHELRTPLTGVVGLSAELRERGSAFDPEEAQELIEMIAEQSQDVANIVEDLLVEARLGQGGIRVSPSVCRVVDLLRVVPSTVPISVEPSDLEVFADAHRFRQILRNLLTNAERYGGPNVWIRAYGQDGAVVVEACDDGTAIPSGKRQAIFEPYQRASGAAGITASVGLGLTVSRGLAELMDGTLTYAFDDGTSIFRLVLPAPEESTIDIDLSIVDSPQEAEAVVQRSNTA